MTSTRNGSAGTNGHAEKYPIERFVTAFGRVITDVDRLMMDLSRITTKETSLSNTKREREEHTLEEAISTLRNHARAFVNSTMRGGTFREFLLEMSQAQTFMSMAQVVKAYCSRTFASPAGMIFLERDKRVYLASEWRSNQISKKHFREERIKSGPVQQALHTGTALFWSPTNSRHEISSFLHDLLPGHQSRSVAFLPIKRPGQPPVGVLAMVVLHSGELPREMRDDMSRFVQVIAGSIERACAYDEVVAAREAAEGTNKLQTDFLSMISHELRNPMTPILNWAIALSTGKLPPERQSFAIEAIIRNVRALNYLIDDLFDAARMASGKLSLNFEEMRIQEAAREALTITQQAAETKKLRITTDISEAIPPFRADPRRVRQVFTNLLSNAVKFTPEGGSIRLKIGMRRGFVECIVTDTGKGMAPEFLPFAFDRFRQEGGKSDARSAGLGLGLAVVREIVELHGGSVKAHSQGADRGSTLIFSLPLRKHKHPGKAGRRPQAKYALKARRLLPKHAI